MTTSKSIIRLVAILGTGILGGLLLLQAGAGCAGSGRGANDNLSSDGTVGDD
ncbi:hypothetical protein ACFL51_01070 [Myxococcota bacterium]